MARQVALALLVNVADDVDVLDVTAVILTTAHRRPNGTTSDPGRTTVTPRSVEVHADPDAVFQPESERA